MSIWNIDDTLPSLLPVESPKNSYPAGHYFLPTFSDGSDSPESPLDLTSYRNSPIPEQNVEMEVEETPNQLTNPTSSTSTDTSTSASQIPNQPPQYNR